MNHETTVRFHHVDAAGILYFSRIFELCHEVLEEVLAAAGFPLRDVLRNREWVMPIVHASSDYRKPMRLGDAIGISVSVREVGKSSLTFLYRISGKDGAVHAEVTLVHVVLDAATFKSRPIPEDFMQALNGLGVVRVAES